MHEDPARVPTFVLAGGTLEERDAAIARLAQPLGAQANRSRAW